MDSQKQRHPSGGVSVSSEMVFELEGVELGADGKVRASLPADTQRYQGQAGRWEQSHTSVPTRQTWSCASLHVKRKGGVDVGLCSPENTALEPIRLPRQPGRA